MKRGPSVTLQGWLAAGLLAVLTLFVFFTLRDYGPESTVRRYHEAVFRADLREINSVTLGGWEDPGVRLVTAGLQEIFSRGGREYGLRGVDRQPNRVVVATEYRYPNGRRGATLWVVRKVRRDGAWQIDAQATIALRQRILGF